jgi:hypothetical protein
MTAAVFVFLVGRAGVTLAFSPAHLLGDGGFRHTNKLHGTTTCGGIGALLAPHSLSVGASRRRLCELAAASDEFPDAKSGIDAHAAEVSDQPCCSCFLVFPCCPTLLPTCT